MKRLLTYLILFLLPQAILFAEEFSVKDFFLAENDLTANTPGTLVKDQNGYVCALIKVETTLDDFSFDVGALGITKTQRVGGEMWVYVPYGVRRITISHPKMGVIRDYAFPVNIEKGRTYILKLNASLGNRVYDSTKKQRMILEVYPADAKVEINGMSMPVKSNGVYDQEYSFGIYDVIVTASRYHTLRKQVEVNDPSSPHRVKLSLKPKFGWLKINGSGDEKLYIDSGFRNHTPGAKIELNSGTYRILLEKPLHKSYSTTVQISDSSTVSLNPVFEPVYRDLHFHVADNAEIWIDGVKMAIGSYRKKLVYGVYDIECRKDNHRTAKTTFEVTPTTEGPVTLPAPEPIMGGLRVSSNVIDADVYINDELAGKTPYSAETIIGTYQIAVKKDGYAVFNRTVSVSEGAENSVYAELDESISPLITSSPNASLIIDGRVIGKTPARPALSIGEHKVQLKANGYADFKKTVLFDDPDKKYAFDLKESMYATKFANLGMGVATNFKDTDISLNLDLYASNILFGIECMFGLNFNDESITFMYNPYGGASEILECSFMPITYLFKGGYYFNAGSRFQFSPVAGLGGYTFMLGYDRGSSEDFETHVKGDQMFTAFQAMVGFKINIAIAKEYEISIMPAFYCRTKGSELFQSVTAQSPYAERYGKGFKLHLGFSIFE